MRQSIRAAVIGLLLPGLVWAQGATLSYSLHQAFEGHPGRIQSAAFSPDGVLLATGDDQGTIKLWDVVGEREVATLKGRGSVAALAFSPDHKVLVSGHTDRTVTVWNTETGALLKTLQGHKGAVYAVAVSPDGQVVASAGDDRAIRLWGTKLGNEMGTLDGHEGRVVSLAFSRDGRTLISGSDDKTLRLWDPTKRKEIRNITESGGKFGTIFATASSPDLQVVAIAMTEVKRDTSSRRSMSGPPIWDKVIKVRNGATGEELIALRGHLQDVKTVSVSADGRFLASGSPDQTVRLWDVQSGREITTIAQKAAVTTVAFSPDGRWLAAAGDDKKVFVWKTTGVMPPTEVARLPGDARREPPAVSKSEMQALLKEALKEAAPPPKPEAPKARPMIPSDIHGPVFGATERVMGENDVAVVIGVEKYRGLPEAEYAAGDARVVKDYLVALGIKERNIQLLMDEDATQSGIKKYLETWLPNRVKKDSKVIIYYSGHGSPDPATGAAYIVPHDGDPNYLADTGYPLKHLYEKLGALPAAEVIVVLDSCFSGAKGERGRSVLAKGARPMVVTREGSILPPNMVVLAATQGAQISTSDPERGHGLFTYHFLKALKDGKKDAAEIYRYIQPLVEDEAKRLNVQQSPSINPEPQQVAGRFRLRN